MATLKPPAVCQSCGAEGTLFFQGNECICRDPDCGRAFPIYPKYGLKGKPETKKTATVKDKPSEIK